PSSGPFNASTLVNPYHVYNTSGTYNVTLFGNNYGNCPDSTKKKIVVIPNVKLTITGTDSVCNGSEAILTAGGGGTYLWSTNATTSTIKVYPTTTTTYTVKVSNGRCYLDTTYTVVIKPIGTGAISGKGSVCLGDTIVLNAYGGGTYVWNTGATTSSITVLANSFKDTAYSVVISNGDSCTSIKKRINIDSVSGYACCSDTIFSGNSTTLNGSGSTTYFWTPPIGLSCDTCPNPIANPTVTTTYTLITTTAAGCTASSLVTITVEIPCADFFVPNVFTPNDNGINDTYLIKVKFMSDYQIDIFNRWGKKVFSSDNPDNPWDGNIDGSPASAGVYYYILRSTCENGESFEKHGFLHLIRN
ncbi:MAG TPA: gliding motility-associated C-terminal domain-containing protein, partial [Bacteroidia bacterium]|nr:gliding motility-associated C-terminal domain-containing protein [Bacteroidia bacterium]